MSIVLQKRWHKNTFKPNENVNLDEYVYVDSKIAKVENPLSQIASSLVGYLTNGQYVDTTGVAIEHHSPQITKESKLRKYMKKTINENHLRAIVAESVKRVLKEGIMGGAMRNVYNDAKNGYTQGYDNFSDFAKGARDYVKNQDSDFGRERYKQYNKQYKNAPKNSEERGYYAQKALENKPGLGGRITRAASVPLVTGAHLAGKIARRFGGNSQVKEAKIYAEVLRMINEDAGHLYWHDENGKAHTNSRETWRGVKGTIYVYHGDWSDPEVLYDGEEINYWDLEESAWDSYKCECEDNGKEPSEQEFDNLPSSWFKEYLDYEYMPGRFGENY